jgi:hypothetical protein
MAAAVDEPNIRSREVVKQAGPSVDEYQTVYAELIMASSPTK